VASVDLLEYGADANRLQDLLEATRGQTNQMMTACVIPEINSDIINNAWNWYDKTLADEPKLNAGTFLLIEMMQKEAFNTVESRTATGWPRANGRHILQLGCGSLNQNATPEVHRKAIDCLGKAAEEIYDKYSVGDCLPRDFEEFHDPVKVGVPILRNETCMHTDRLADVRRERREAEGDKETCGSEEPTQRSLQPLDKGHIRVPRTTDVRK
jgi:hypothetical protein